MANFNQNAEGGRPPEPSLEQNRKFTDRKLCPVTSMAVPWTSRTIKTEEKYKLSKKLFNNNSLLGVVHFMADLNENLTDEIKCQPVHLTKQEKTSLKRKLLCLKKQESQKQLNTLNAGTLEAENYKVYRPGDLSQPPSCSRDSTSCQKRQNPQKQLNILKGCTLGEENCKVYKPGDLNQPPSCSSDRTVPRSRHSYPQNVEEALSSILWQPYEYQNKRKSSSSSCSSCSSASSMDDLDETNNTSPTDGYGITADLHRDSLMVNNLHEVYGQSERGISSRDTDLTLSSLLKLRATSFSSAQAACVSHGQKRNVAVTTSVGLCYESAMQLEVPNNTQSASNSSILNINTSENGVKSNITVQQNKTLDTSRCKSLTPSLISANVVGLPTGFGTVPSVQQQTRSQSGTIFNHSRQISEPATNQFRLSNNVVPISSSNVVLNSNVVPNHQRHTSQIEQSNLQLISHLRSASVPKSMPHQNGSSNGTHFVSTNSINPQTNHFMQNPIVPTHSRVHSEPSTKFQSQKVPSNVSNVNVNFYRAVPVNVVSSVPTIQCLNTLSTIDASNNVCNVQIEPQIQYQPKNNLQINNINQLNQSITGTTQVTVHNTPTSTHSIQIPTNFQNRNVPNGNNNQIIIQNARSTTMVPQVPVKSVSTATSTNQIVLNNRSTTNSLVPSTVPTLTNQIVVQNNTLVPSIVPSNPVIARTRTFTSTEAQTDDINGTGGTTELPSASREQRRRERRERRHQRRLNSANHRHSIEQSTQSTQSTGTQNNDRLPDILNSHLPPPYSTLPGNAPGPNNMVPSVVPNHNIVPGSGMIHHMPNPNMLGNPVLVPNPVMVPNPSMVPQMVPPPHGAMLQTVVPNNVVPSGYAFPQNMVPGQVPLVQGATPVAVTVPPPTGFRFPFTNGAFRRGRFSEESPKNCCGLLAWKPGSLRWFIALIALVAVCCVLVGTALGAMRPAGRDHLTVSLLMIGVGIVLVTVSGVAWKLTSHDSATCRSMLGLGSTESVDVCTRRFVPRLPPSYGRPHHPYAAMMYPEFQYRPPPPSYQASMQEYRLRLLLLDRGNTPQIQSGIQNAVSPPPTYRSHAGSLLRVPLSNRRDASQSEYSCPPSYRSQNSMNRQGALPPNSVLHSREQSLSLSESNNGGSVVNVVNILGSTEEDIALDNITLDSLKMEPDCTDSDLNPLRMLLKGSSSDLEGNKDGNLVTIVQTSDQNPVIVTVSGSSQVETNNSNNSVQITELPSEMEILAHL